MEDELYRELIIEHYQHPHNTGRLEGASFAARELNPVCGDEIKLFIKIENSRVADVKFDGQGCAISQASASIVTDWMFGKTVEELRALREQDVLEMLGLGEGTARLKCALLPLNTLKKGLESYE